MRSSNFAGPDQSGNKGRKTTAENGRKASKREIEKPRLANEKAMKGEGEQDNGEGNGWKGPASHWPEQLMPRKRRKVRHQRKTLFLGKD